ncbi:MAG TPA: nucleoside diphosphate kinase regulator [Syntrophobacteraceae bacterium]|nr:nucleoside diphosphate kinase regulator [Syntrophobacteraceae bacterium]
MARKRKIYVTEFDMKRLEKLIDLLNEVPDRDQKRLLELEDELNRAKVVAPREIPQDVVTMNSTVRVKDLSTNEEIVYCLVFPGEANAGQNKISILAPIGTALIGGRVGDIVEWQVPAGIIRFKIEEVLYQPEAAGDYRL